MSEIVTIRGNQFKSKAFADMDFDKFKTLYEKQMPYKRIAPRDRESALKEDYEKLTGNKPGKRERKTYKETKESE